MTKYITKQNYLRFAIFILYFWFGFLKVLDLSPAQEIVIAMQELTMPFIPTLLFFQLLGIGEMLLGIAFLMPSLTNITKKLFYIHMIATMLPLIVLPDLSWSSFGALTLEGQYIFKNLALIGVVLMIKDPTRKPLL